MKLKMNCFCACFLLWALPFAGYAEKPLAFYVRQVNQVERRFDAAKKKQAVTAGKEVLKAAKQKEAPNAVYPLIHSSKIRMNGNLADWDDIPFTGKLEFQSDNERLPLPEGLAASFKAAVSDDTLYLLAVAKDRHVTFGVNKTAYNNDCFELFLDPFFTRAEKSDDSTIQLFITADGKDGKKFTVQGKIPVKAAAVGVKDGWGVELAIPLSNDFFKINVFDGLAIGFNLCYNNNDNGKLRQHKLSWSGIDRSDSSWLCPALYGALETVSSDVRKPVPAEEGRRIRENRLRRESGETLADVSILPKLKPSPPVVRGFQMGRFDDNAAEEVRRWGANAVRLQYNPAGNRNRKGDWKKNWPAYLDFIESQVKRAQAHGLKVIIDMHAAPVAGGGSLWKNPELETNFIKVWRDIAIRLKPYRNTIWGYDLYNEPVDRPQLPYAPAEWRQLAVKLIKAIREVDPETWIIYEAGPGGGSRGFDGLKPLPDPKVIYSCHFYTPGAFTHQGIAATKLQDPGLMAKAQEKAGIKYPGLIGGIEWNRERLEKSLSDVIEFQKKYKAPIYIGEFSVIAWAPKESAARYLQDVIGIFEKYGWSWTYHAFREYPGWSLEHEDGTLRPNGSLKRVKNSVRGEVVKEFLKRNENGEK